MNFEQYKTLTQQQLRQLNSSSGTLLLLDVPDGLQFGIDNIIWKTGSKFKGIKFIPFGPHIISYSLQQQNHQFKINKFLIFDRSKGSQNQILILKWSFKYSMFLELKGAEVQGYREGVKNYHFDSYLGPYPSSNLQFWKENSSFITRQVLEKLEPLERIYKFEEEYEKVKENKIQEQVRIDVDEEDEAIQYDEENQFMDQEVNQFVDKDINQFLDKKINHQMEKEVNKFMGNELNKGKRDEKHQMDLQQKLQEAQKQQQALPVKQAINKRFQALTDTIYYTQIPRLLTNDPSHITKINLNKTELLLSVIFKLYLPINPTKDDPQTHHKQHQTHHIQVQIHHPQPQTHHSQILGILGQLQYAFIYFLIGQDFDSLQQWKKLVNLIVFSQDIFETRQILSLKQKQLSQCNNQLHLNNSCQKVSLIESLQRLSLQFIVVLYNQLKQFPPDFFMDQLSQNSFLQTCLYRLHSYRSETQGIISKKVKKRLQKLFKLLSTKFNYQPQYSHLQDNHEDAPTVVQQHQSYF